MFYGSEFIFDGRSCREFGLMIYDFGSKEQGDETDFATGKIIEDRVPSRYDSLFYGTEHDKPLEFNLVFGVDVDFVTEGMPLDRYEIEDIASWLVGHQELKWLSIVQPDMAGYRYRCCISELSLCSHANLPWAFSCKVTCDSPFAYTVPQSFKVDIPGVKHFSFYNRSTLNGYYYPTLILRVPNGGNIKIVNTTDNRDRVFEFKNLPLNAAIKIDNKNQIITDLNGGSNLYQNFNFNFLRLIRGDNILQAEGEFSLEIICEFPVIIGG